MKKKKRIFILIIAVLIIIGSGVYLGTYYHAVDIENDLTTSDTIQVKDFNQGIFFRWSWNNRCPVQKWTQPPTHIPNSFSNMKMGNINQESH